MLPDVKFQTCVNFTKSETYYHLHFCHACLNLLMDELAVAQCSSFVKHHEWIPAMYFFVMFECFSLLLLIGASYVVVLSMSSFYAMYS